MTSCSSWSQIHFVPTATKFEKRKFSNNIVRRTAKSESTSQLRTCSSQSLFTCFVIRHSWNSTNICCGITSHFLWLFSWTTQKQSIPGRGESWYTYTSRWADYDIHLETFESQLIVSSIITSNWMVKVTAATVTGNGRWPRTCHVRLSTGPMDHGGTVRLTSI